MRIDQETMTSRFKHILMQHDYSDEAATQCADLLTKASLDGVYSHGVNRFIEFVSWIKQGVILPKNTPKQVGGIGGLERWDGRYGSGPNNALFAMQRAIDLSRQHGIACIGLRNTNHWMRAGNFGWQAADQGVIGICFGNTKPNLVPWGALEPKTGNNPMVIAIPRIKGHIVIDTSMSQFSYGKMKEYQREGMEMPYPAGFDDSGNITHDPKIIIERELALPIGYWKGSGLSIVLDMMATMISNGRSTMEIGTETHETGLSQTFIAINPEALDDWSEDKLDDMVDNIKNAKRRDENQPIYYPGEKSMMTREENLELGIPVDKEIWEGIKQLDA
ncbi:MAG: 3-dehydro-L-gulonate 2-dehydrogenase [Cyclobacteriaceae bacterium]